MCELVSFSYGLQCPSKLGIAKAWWSIGVFILALKPSTKAKYSTHFVGQVGQFFTTWGRRVMRFMKAFSVDDETNGEATESLASRKAMKCVGIRISQPNGNPLWLIVIHNLFESIIIPDYKKSMTRFIQSWIHSNPFFLIDRVKTIVNRKFRPFNSSIYRQLQHVQLKPWLEKACIGGYTTLC